MVQLKTMDLSANDDETMSRNRSEYVNQLLEQNRQLRIQIKQERINVKALNDRLDELEDSYAKQRLQLQRAQDIINQDGASLSIQELLSKNIRALQAIVREYQTTSATCSEESIRVLEKNLQATEAQLKKTEEDLRIRNEEYSKLERSLEVARRQLDSSENSVISRSESITYELKRELMQCQVALADCRNEKEEVLKELHRVHEEFASCKDADYTRECELKLIAADERIEELNGTLAKEREGRLLDTDAHNRAINAAREKENQFQLRIELLQKELMEKCNEIGALNEKLEELTNRNAYLQDAAENSLSYQAAAKKREEELQQQITDLSSRLRQVEDRCIELLQIKIGLEKDVRRLRNEITTLTESENDARVKCSEQEKIAALAVRKADLTIKQVHEEMLETLAGNKSRHEYLLAREKEGRQEEVQQLNATISSKQQEIEEAEQRILQQKKEHEEEISRLRTELQNSFSKTLSNRLQEQKAELEAAAEKARSDLELRMVHMKEKVLAEQTEVFKRELAAGEAASLQTKQALEARLESERKTLVEKAAKEKEALIEATRKEKESYIAAAKKEKESYLASAKKERETILETARQEKEELTQKSQKELQDLHALFDKEGDNYRHVIGDLRAAIDAKDTRIRQLDQEKKSLETSVAANESELQSLRSAVITLQQNGANGANGANGENGESAESTPLEELVKEEEKKRLEVAKRLEELEKRAVDAEKQVAAMNEELEAERMERQDESKQQQEKITELKKKCLKLKAYVAKMKDKSSPEPKKDKSSPELKKKTLQRTGKHHTGSVGSDSDDSLSNDSLHL